MKITHAKTSPSPNPADPDVVGGEDWNNSHVVVGPRLVTAVRFTRNGTGYDTTGVSVSMVGDWDYDVTFNAAYDIKKFPIENHIFRATVTDINPALGFFASAVMTADNVVRVTTYTGDWAETWITSASAAIWLEVFKTDGAIG